MIDVQSRLVDFIIIYWQKLHLIGIEIRLKFIRIHKIFSDDLIIVLVVFSSVPEKFRLNCINLSSFFAQIYKTNDLIYVPILSDKVSIENFMPKLLGDLQNWLNNTSF